MNVVSCIVLVMSADFNAPPAPEIVGNLLTPGAVYHYSREVGFDDGWRCRSNLLFKAKITNSRCLDYEVYNAKIGDSEVKVSKRMVKDGITTQWLFEVDAFPRPHVSFDIHVFDNCEA